MNRFIIVILFVLDSLLSTGQSFDGTYNYGDSFYVFIGQKVNVERIRRRLSDSDSGIHFSMYSAYKAKYKVIQNIYNKLPDDTLEFEVYDHYGKPAFSRYKTVLLFVQKERGRYYHELYQYFDVYQTKDGRWASPGNPYRFDELHKNQIKAVRLDFRKPLKFNLKKLSREKIEQLYPKPYYIIVKNHAIAIMGSYVEQLLEIKQEGTLKARHIFL